MDLRAGFALLILLGCYGFLQAMDSACPSEMDALEELTMVDDANEKQHLRQTSNIYRNELADIGREQIEEFYEAVSMENITAAVNDTPYEVRSAGDLDSGVSSAQDFAVLYYYRICPHSWYLLRRYQWYWRVWTSSSNTITIDYWFTYWWVWATWCPHRYCSLSYFPFQSHWDPRYRCYPEYRAVWLPMVCYRWTIVKGRGYGRWVTWQWRKVYVPRGCCCRRYWYWYSINSQKCPAIP